MTVAEIRSLSENASARGAHDVVTLRETVLGTKLEPAVVHAKWKAPPPGHPRLISRSKAMEMRGVQLHNPGWSWDAIRESDVAVVRIAACSAPGSPAAMSGPCSTV